MLFDKLHKNVVDRITIVKRITYKIVTRLITLDG